MIIPGFTLLVDDKDIELYGMALVSYETQSYVERKTIGIDIPGSHGTQAVPSALSSSGFVAKVICTGQSVDEVHSHIRQFFAYMYSTPQAHKIVFTDDMRAVRYAILDSPDRYKVINGMDGALAELNLTFYMMDPFTYQSESDKLVKAVKHREEVLLENESYECPAIYTLENTGSVSVTGICLMVNDELVKYSCALNKGDKIVLDTIEYEVKLNGEIRLDYWDGEMPMLKNGDNIIYQQNTQKASLLLTVEFTRQWV